METKTNPITVLANSGRPSPETFVLDADTRAIWLQVTGPKGGTIMQRLSSSVMRWTVYRVRKENDRSCPLEMIARLIMLCARCGVTEAQLRLIPIFINRVIEDAFNGKSLRSLDDIDRDEQLLESRENELALERRIGAVTPDRLEAEALGQRAGSRGEYRASAASPSLEGARPSVPVTSPDLIKHETPAIGLGLVTSVVRSVGAAALRENYPLRRSERNTMKTKRSKQKLTINSEFRERIDAYKERRAAWYAASEDPGDRLYGRMNDAAYDVAYWILLDLGEHETPKRVLAARPSPVLADHPGVPASLYLDRDESGDPRLVTTEAR